MKNILKTTLLGFTAFAACLMLAFVAPPKASAYEAGNLISNHVFLDANSMSKADIQNFLVSKGSGLKSMSFNLQCYDANSKERQLYTAAGARCDTPIPASEIIYYAAQIYGVSPKAILATLQKEQSLITAPNPTSWQVNQAMGYACPTSGSCGGNSTFSYQIDLGVWTLRRNYERARGNFNWWSPSSSWVCGTEKDLYKPNLYPGQNVRFYDTNGTHYTTVYIEAAATSAMYCYTPHAYNNPQGLYGNPRHGTTGLYYSGSYNFVKIFEQWFGSTTLPGSEAITARYNELGGASGVLGNPVTDFVIVNSNRSYRTYQNGTIVWRNGLGAWETLNGPIRDRWITLGAGDGVMGSPITGVVTVRQGLVYQQFQNGVITLTDSGAWETINGVVRDKWIQLGGSDGALGAPVGGLTVTSDGRTYQQFRNGSIFHNQHSGTWEVLSGPIRTRWGDLGGSTGVLGMPTSAVATANGRTFQYFQNGVIIYRESTGAWESVNGPIRDKWVQLGASDGALGSPIGGLTTTGDGRVYQQYQNGSIFHNQHSGTWEVLSGPIRTRWGDLNGSIGVLGIPTGAPTTTNGRTYQYFQNGVIIYRQSTGAWESVNGPIRDKWAELGGSEGTAGSPTGPIVNSSNTSAHQEYQNGTIRWTTSAGAWYEPRN